MYQPNPGHLPPECEILDEDGELVGYRAVHVRLENGWCSRKAGCAPCPAAGGRPAPTRWSRTPGRPHPFDIKEFEVAE